MKNILKNKFLQELLIYLTIVILLAVQTHNDLLSFNLERFDRLWDTAVLFGMFHPLVYGFVGYIAFYFVRGIYRTIRGIFN